LSSPKGKRAASVFIVLTILALALAPISIVLTIITIILGLAVSGSILYSRKETRVLRWHDTDSPSHRSRAAAQILVAKIDISDILDPVTGTGFDDREVAWRCTTCQMFYHDQTYSFLRDQNSSRCVGCGQSRLQRTRVGAAEEVIIKPEAPARGFEFERRYGFRRGSREQLVFEPPVLRLSEVAQYTGHIVYFQGKVVEVQKSRATSTYCVKFQRGPWPSVFKLVIFPNYVGNFALGGQTITDYERKTIRVRGLIQDHPEWGLEIIVYSENAITVLD
jgi:hypothetical protein